MKIVS